jgi:uncharacterized protein YbjT (DUF2867 family)
VRVAITGGTGFVGAHLAKALVSQGHEVVLLARGVDERPLAREAVALPGVRVARTGVGDPDGLLSAFRGADAVAHCAGINRELGPQTYAAVHVQGTRNVVAAAERAGVRRLALLSFLRARPDCGSGYHESKWAAEEILRASGLEWTVLKPGMMYGRGDHMLDHLSHALHTLPVFADLGRTPVRPLAIADAVEVLVAALVHGRLPRRTVPLTGPTELALNAAVRLVEDAIGRHPPLVPLPFGALPPLAWLFERTMQVPMLSLAQARILREGVVEPVLAPDPLPPDLAPRTPFDLASVRAGLPAPGPFTREDWRVCRVCAWQG